MKENEIISDSNLGIIHIKRHASASRIIFHSRNRHLIVTAPPYASVLYIEECIQRHRSQLLKLIEHSRAPLLQAGNEIDTRAFTIKIRQNNTQEIAFRLKGEILEIDCPSGCAFENPEIQSVLSKGICKYLKLTAGQYLLPRARQLAREKQLKVNRIALSHGKKRLGKCTADRNIFLSYYLMFLPEELIDYVIYHELAHLTEMNHGVGFHQLCDNYCNGAEKELERRLKAFRFPIE